MTPKPQKELKKILLKWYGVDYDNCLKELSSLFAEKEKEMLKHDKIVERLDKVYPQGVPFIVKLAIDNAIKETREAQQQKIKELEAELRKRSNAPLFG